MRATEVKISRWSRKTGFGSGTIELMGRRGAFCRGFGKYGVSAHVFHWLTCPTGINSDLEKTESCALNASSTALAAQSDQIHLQRRI